MTISDSSKNTGSTANTGSFNMDAATAAPQQTAQAVPQQTAVSGAPRSFATLFQAPIGRYAGSESIKELQSKIDDVVKPLLPAADFEYALMVLDNQNNAGLAFGVIAFCLVNKQRNNQLVAVHTLIVEATAPALQSRTVNEAGHQVEILQPASVAWDQTLINLVRNTVAEKFRNRKPVMVDATVVPRTFNPNIQENLHDLVRNTLVAVATEIDMRSPGFQDVNLQQLQHGNLTVGLTVASKQQTDDVGLPQRSNVEVVYQDNAQNNNANNGANYSVNSQDRATLIGSFDGFIDFGWAPVVNSTNIYAQAYTQQQPLANGLLHTHKFAARLVLTNVNAAAIATPPAVLNLLSPMTAIVDDMSWVQTFKSRGVKSRFHDIGGLNIEGNLGGDPATAGTKIETSSDDFKDEHLYQFVGSLVRPGMAIALDVPDAGPQTWFLSVFKEAANGNPGAQEALIAAANTLTAGNFSRHFPANASVFQDLGNRVHLGYYDNNGVMEDIRNVDYLAVANTKGIDNPEILRKYTDTFQAGDHISLQRRLDERARIIREVVPTVVFTGFATRCTFTPEFIMALWAGIKACGVSPTVTRNGMSGALQVNRATAGFANGGLLLPGQIQGNFNQGQTLQTNRFNGIASMDGGRW